MTDVRALFVETALAAQGLLFEPALAERFDKASALAEFPVRGLAGHLLRAMTSVEGYLARPEPDRGVGAVSPAEYYAAVAAGGNDIDSDLHRAVRQRGLDEAAGTAEELALAWSDTVARLAGRLGSEPPGRLVELFVHADDLAASLGVPPPPLPAAATGLVIATLVEVARIRHGDAAVLRALARRERDAVEALRVL